MEYELATELMDAGYKYHWVYGWNDDANRMEFKSYPSLEELIEACGDKLDGVYRGINCWYAYGSKPKTIYVEKTGATPIEAVAHFWLA
jgi:hypothetical protein